MTILHPERFFRISVRFLSITDKSFQVGLVYRGWVWCLILLCMSIRLRPYSQKCIRHRFCCYHHRSPVRIDAHPRIFIRNSLQRLLHRSMTTFGTRQCKYYIYFMIYSPNSMLNMGRMWNHVGRDLWGKQCLLNMHHSWNSKLHLNRSNIGYYWDLSMYRMKRGKPHISIHFYNTLNCIRTSLH